jgi:alpha-2-macroglobulin
LFDTDKKLAVFEFSFRVIQQMFSVDFDGLASVDQASGRWNSFNGQIKTADYIEGKEVERLFKAHQGKRQLTVRWDHNPGGTIHGFVVDSVERKTDRDKLVLSWDGKSLGIEQKGEKMIDIPGVDEFIIMDTRVVQYPDQHVVIHFSDPLVRNQQLQGLVQLDNEAGLRYQVDGNRLRVFPANRLTGTFRLTVNQGIQSSFGNRFIESQAFSMLFEDILPAVRLRGRGVIMPGSDHLVFPFEAVSLRAIDLRIIKIYETNVAHFLQVNTLDGDNQLKRAGRLIFQQTIPLQSDRPLDLLGWNAFSVDISKMIQAEPGAIYRVEIGFKREHAVYPCGDDVPDDESLRLMTAGGGEIQDADMAYWDDPDTYWDSGSPYGWYESWYNWEERDDPCSRSYYGREKSVSRNILASNIGIIAKGESDQNLFFAVTDLRTAMPLPQVILDVYNYQNQSIGSVVTDKQGMARIRSKDKPYLLIARQNDQRGYLRLDDGSALSLSRFDVIGLQVQKGIKGFIYGDRGVWRPGDTLHLVFVLEDKQKQLPENHPISFELQNPMGQVVTSESHSRGQNGFYYFKVETSPDAPTGNWYAQVRVGGLSFGKTLKLETIKPNRLKIDLNFGTPLLLPGRQAAEGRMQVNWLHGAPGRNLRVHVSATLTPQKTIFPQHPDFTFDDPSRRFDSQEITVFDGTTDASGFVAVSPGISVREAAPGMLQAHFVTRAFEEGGDFSIDRFSMPYSPYQVYVGIKVPEGEQYTGMLVNDTDHEVAVVTLDANGRPVSRNNIQVDMYKIQWRWWWDASGENLASYMGGTQHQAVFSKTISTTNGRGAFTFRVPHPDWGRYLIRVSDPSGGHSTGTLVYIDWPGWASRAHGDDPEAATMLSITTDKEKYQVGEQLQVTLPALQQGRALVSLESGSRVVDAYWVEAKGEDMRISIPVTAQMAPNMYLHISYIQPHAQTVNDLPIRMYGVVPVFVEDPASRLTPILETPETLRPGTSANIRVREKDGKPFTYTLAIVDEGLLALTRFKTPDIWSAFYAREALGIKTWDMYDFVIGAYGGRLEQIFSVGGDEALIQPPQSQANRFKPMVKFIGPFTLEKGRTNTHNIDIPQYVGAVRAMLIAGNQGAYGHAEKTIQVKNPLMVLATMPRVLSPGESLKLPVSVFAMDDHVRDVKVEVRVNNIVTLTTGSSRQVTFSQPGDQVIDFDIQVGRNPGVAKVQVLAVSGSERAEYVLEVGVRNPNPRIMTSLEAIVEPGKEWATSFSPIGTPGTNSALLEFSSIPPINFGRRLKYLIDYPHGCVEQITSAAFPQLFLGVVMDMDAALITHTENNIKEAIRLIASYQMPDGGMRYWPGADAANDWGSTYAGHFLLEAEALGYALPGRVKENWISFQRNRARSWTSAPSDSRHPSAGLSDLSQAYRLYSLALANAPEMGAMNRLREHSELSVQARWRLAAAYALAGQPEAANALIDGVSKVIQPYNAFNASFGSKDRDLAMILETLSLMDRREDGVALVRQLSDALTSQNWMSTQTTAWCLMAMSKFAKGQGPGSDLRLSYSLDGGRETNLSVKKAVSQVAVDVNQLKSYELQVRNTGDGMLFARLILSGIPEAEAVKADENMLRMAVQYRDMSGKLLDVSRLSQGIDFLAEVSVTHPGGAGNYTDMVLTQVFPSGWEIHNTRMDDFVSVHQADMPSYQDIRDDRVHTHFDLAPGQTKKFVVMLHAAYLGHYLLPGVFCEAMYNDRVYARLPGKWIDVTVPGD